MVADIYVASWNEGFAALMPPRVLGHDQVHRWHRDLAEESTRWVVAQTEDRVVGFVGTGPSRDPLAPGLGELDTIAVQPSAWRHGIGRLLMDAALADLRAADFRNAILWTLAGYTRGTAFYEATGWHASGETRDSGGQVAFRQSLTDSARA